MEFERANLYKAVFLFLFLRKKYITAAINHGMATNLEASDLFEKYKEGTFPAEGWEVGAKKNAMKAAEQLGKGLWGSFLAILIVALIALLVGYYNGSVHPSLPVDYGLAATFIGTFLASWATMMELGGGFATFGGVALHELIHPVMFKLLFVPGVCLLLLGVAV